MIHVAGLTKRYGPVKALDRVSFDVGEGEILGFLGPNGAGKSTTLRILTGFLPPDEGTVIVAGHDIRTDSLRARAITGYLPEGVPLYPELRVSEYLRFRARLKGVPRSGRREAIRKVLDQAGVGDVEKRIIGTLSKGYRQRVGVADALLGGPRILVLDEPTVGLDPEQVRQFRQLLIDLGKTLTIILSTHILSEVEQVANRISIIVRGRIAAQDTTGNLRAHLGSLDRVRAEIAGPAGTAPEAVAGEIRRLPGVEAVKVETVASGAPAGGRTFAVHLIRPREEHDPREAVFALARDKGWILRELTRLPLSLEEIFHEVIAGRAERDDARREADR